MRPVPRIRDRIQVIVAGRVTVVAMGVADTAATDSAETNTADAATGIAASGQVASDRADSAVSGRAATSDEVEDAADVVGEETSDRQFCCCWRNLPCTATS